MKLSKKQVKKLIEYIILGIIVSLIVYIIVKVIIGLVTNTPTCIFNHYFMVVATNSMEGTINVGEMVIVRKVDFSSINVDDIISFYCIDKSQAVYGEVITHRVIGIDTTVNGLITQGDNNPIADSYMVYADNFLGKVVSINPFIGKVFSFFKSSNITIFLIIFVILFAIVAMEIKNILILKDKMKKEKEIEKAKEEILKEIKKEDNHEED